MFSTHLVIQPTTNSARRPAVLVQEVGEVGLASANVVVDGVLVLAAREELDGREGADAVLGRNRAVLLGVGIEVGDHAL